MIPARCASLCFFLLGLLTTNTAARDPMSPSLPNADRVRIAEAFRLADALGNRVWPDWDKAPFAVLLVTPEHEFLIRHPKPSDDFTLIGQDAVLKQNVWFRKRQYPTRLLATFPAVSNVPTIVIGQAENTEAKTSTRWVITLLHEHFHQLQNSQPRYFANVDALGLARGDQTGMWMLNYPFPYAVPEVKDQFATLCRALAEALQAREQPGFSKQFAAYVAAKKKFQSLLKPDDGKYLSFQVWQEGIARYTEYRLARLAAGEYRPTKEFQALKDFTSFNEVEASILRNIEKELASVQLDKAKREVVYNFGAAEGLVLDRANPEWRKRYFEKMLSLEEHFAAKNGRTIRPGLE
jgi:hypothetical protein